MLRKIIKINSAKCNGCGLCVSACHEGAIVMQNGKATLLRDDYCDGLGDCLPACPTGAISFEEREALAYDEDAVLANIQRKKGLLKNPTESPQFIQARGSACAGSQARNLFSQAQTTPCMPSGIESKLKQWPVQIKLVPSNAPYFNNAHLLIAADCTAFAYANFHNDFLNGKITLIGCPKLDNQDYAIKLLDIIKQNNILSLTVVRMSVPCCSGLEKFAYKALQESEKDIPWQVINITPEGQIVSK